jgi:hypothetical protein
MKIVCIGGGPAGLYFGLLMKQLDPAHDITVVERNRPYDTFGWGVVFSDATMDNMRRWDAATADEKDAADREAKIKQLAELAPEDYARYVAEDSLRRQAERSRLEREAHEQARQELEDNVAAREKARAAAQTEVAEVNAQAKAMSDASPMETWWHSRSTGQKVAGYLAAFLGGFLSSKTGGRNTALDMMMKVAEDDAAQKWKKLGDRRGAAQDALGSADSDFRTRDAIRLASYDQLLRGIDSEMALYDPEGSTALQLADARRQVESQRLMTAKGIEEESYKRGVEAFKADTDRMRAEADVLRANAEAAKKLGLAGGGGGGAMLTPQQLAAKYKLTPEQTPTTAMGETEFLKKWLPAQQKLSGITADIARQESAELDRQLKVNEVTVTDPATGGDLFRARTVKEAEAARTKVQAARQLVNYIDEILAIRDRVGGESSWGNSDDYQRLKVLASNIRLLKKSDTQGMSSDKDIEIIADAVGAASPASFRARAAGLKRARAIVESQLNGFLHDGQGYQGPPIKFRNLYGQKKAPRDPDVDALVGRDAGGGIGDPAVAEALAAQGVAPPSGPIGPDRPRGPAGPSGPAAPGRDSQAYVDAAHEVAGSDAISDADKQRMAAELTPPQQKALDNLVEAAKKGDAAAARKLAQVAADTRTNRRAASAALIALTSLAGNGNKVALKAMQRQIDPDMVDDDDEGGE